VHITCEAALVIGITAISASCTAFSQTHLVTARDCVNVRYVNDVSINHRGTKIAYVVKAPDVTSNRNDYQLFVKDMADTSRSNGTVLLTSTVIQDVKWLGDDDGLTMLTARDGVTRFIIINIADGLTEAGFDEAGSIDSYTVDASGSTVVYSVKSPMAFVHRGADDQERNAVGYLNTFGDPGGRGLSSSDMYSLYVRHKGSTGAWSQPELLSIQNPITHNVSTSLEEARYLSLSPDGSLLLLASLTKQLPRGWENDPVVQDFAHVGVYEVMLLYNLNDRKTSLAFDSISPSITPLWSSDGRSFLLNAHSPVGSEWELKDIQAHRTSAGDANLFLVNVDSREVEEVVAHVPEHHVGPIGWSENGDVLVLTPQDDAARLRRVDGTWREVGRIAIPKTPADRFKYVTSNGDVLVGVHETVTVPQDLFVYQTGWTGIRLLTEINPQLNSVEFVPVRQIQWSTTEGLQVSGLLFMPPDYKANERYPLVIQTKGDQGWFTCDSGFNHDPSFAPQPLAAAGILYLIRTTDAGWNFEEEEAKRPKGYPGNIAEAVQQMDIWDSVVDTLNKQGLIDPSKVGIVGFSRTGWQVEFDLVHAQTHFAAATSADSAHYSLSEYWLVPALSSDEESMYGGPPYGATLKNWMDYSVSFNLQNIHTPILMEEMGYGAYENVPNEVPVDLAIRYELTRGLQRLRKPFELYYYPDERHQLDHPRARLASLERNVDWYRFWLQGYERQTPEDPDQYKRWRLLRNMQDDDAKASGHVQNNTSRPN
jgi:dipeptidyl aminopeptidase/acylaminoacyl peptidase